MTSERLRQQFEGLLCKYTNVVKGWQYRWFVLDPETGVLEYYLNESERRQRPRGSVHLAAAVISPSDEDSNTFTVNSATGELFKLRAADARARHEWVSRIRAVAEMHTMAIAQSNPPLPPREHHVSPHSTGMAVAGPSSQSGTTRVQCSLAVLDAFSDARDLIQRADQSAYAMGRAIEELPGSGPHIKNIDENLLLFKATAQATVCCLNQCLSILQQQQIATPMPSGFRSSQPLTVGSTSGTVARRIVSQPSHTDDVDSKKSSQYDPVLPDPIVSADTKDSARTAAVVTTTTTTVQNWNSTFTTPLPQNDYDESLKAQSV